MAVAAGWRAGLQWRAGGLAEWEPAERQLGAVLCLLAALCVLRVVLVGVCPTCAASCLLLFPTSPLQVRTATDDFDAGLIFEQDPVQIVDALLPLYLNASLLRSLQEALASELAARMNAMSNASDNAGELKKSLSRIMNRKRQARITTELSEIVAGASSV